MIDKLLLKVKCKIHNIELVDISERALGKYRCKIKNNSEESIDICIHKLIRNWNVAKIFYEDKDIVKKAYGNLTMVYHKKEEKIINVYNHYGSIRNNIDWNRKKLVDKILGIPRKEVI
jgi:hypothetical protein